MALKDCLRKLGKLISKEDKQLIQSYLDAGLNDQQAVQRYLLATDEELVEVTLRAKEQGATVKDYPDVLQKIRSFADMQYEKASRELDKLNGQLGDLQETLDQIQWIKDMVSHWVLGVEPDGTPMREYDPSGIDLEDPGELQRKLSAMLFANPGAFKRGYGDLLKGSTPIELYNSWQAMLEKEQAAFEEMRPVAAQKIEAENRLKEIDPERFKAEKKPVVREYNQDLVDQMNAEIEFGNQDVEVTADIDRLAAMLGPQLYGNMKDMSEVTIKELVQNAVDGLRDVMGKPGEPENLRVEIETNFSDRTVTVRDNGIGMSPDVLINAFLRIAGTKKRSDRPGGGFGVAKMLFLFGGKRIQVRTVHNGVLTVMDTTGDELVASTQKGAKKPQITTSRTSEPNGTEVTITIPEDFRDPSTGEMRNIFGPSEYAVDKVMKNSPLLDEIEVLNNGETLQVGRHFSANDYQVVSSVSLDWGFVDILVSRKEDPEETGRQNLHVLSNGLWQFSQSLKQDPFAFAGPSVPRRFYLNVRPKVKPDEHGYPFALNRQSFTSEAGKDLTKILNYLSAIYSSDQTEKLAAGFGAVRQIGHDGALTDPINLRPEPSKIKRPSFRFDPNDMIEIVDGIIYLNGKEVEPITQESYKSARIDLSDFKIDQKLIDPALPMIHSSVINSASGKGLLDEVVEEFGEERVVAYLHGITKEFLRIRNLIGLVGRDDFKGIDDVPVGTFIDSAAGDYPEGKFGGTLGQHIKVPFQGMFVNPGQTSADSALTGQRWPGLSKEGQAVLIASHMMTTMMHEIAHFAEFNHELSFINALQTVMASSQMHLDLTGMAERLGRHIGDNIEIYEAISLRLHDRAYSNPGASLEGTSQLGGQDAGVSTDRTRVSEEGRKPSGAREQAGEGTGATEGQFLDEGFSDGIGKTRSVEAAPGSVHPQAGNGSRLDLVLGHDYDGFVADEYDQTVYHGSPHTFDMFEMGRIGTGEGIQAFGFGLYFSERREVAAFYMRSNDTAGIVANSQLVKFKGDRQKAIENLRSGKSGFSKKFANRAALILEGRSEELGGHVYQVEIDDAAIEKMLNWDAPLSDQPGMVEAFHAAIKAAGVDNLAKIRLDEFGSLTGQEAYRTLERVVLGGNTERASQLLNEAGVPGIKFLDAKSRTTSMQRGKGGFISGLADALSEKATRNMVLFSTAPISSVIRDGQQVFKRDSAFTKWFGDSKIVDRTGEPLVVYHGTADSFDAFDLEHPNRKDTGWLGTGVYMTTDPSLASSYSNIKRGADYPNVMPLFVSIKNPYYATHEEKNKFKSVEFRDPAEARRLADAWVVSLRKQGYDGVILKYDEGGKNESMEVVAFEPTQVKSAIGNEGTYDPKNPNILKQDRRGFITFNEARKAFISLGNQSNLSTFIHETGHLYLEVMRMAVEHENAPQQIVDDWNKILKFLGVTHGSQIETKHHEKWAKSFELYAMEGKAPDPQMQDAFNSFRRWLLNIYRSLREFVGIELNDEIRGVMDRMLASDEAIAQAEQVQEFAALFTTAESAGMTQEQFAVYQKALIRAHNDAVDRETKRLLYYLEREQSLWRANEREKVREEVAQEAYKERVYIALSFLQRGKNPDGTPVTTTAPFKINKASLLKLVQGDQDMLNRLPRPFIYSAQGGVDVEVAAQRFGYKDALKMIQQMIEAQPMEKWIEAETDVRMLQRYPDPLTDGTLSDQAVVAVHDQRRAEIIAAEMRQLRKLVRESRAAVAAARSADKRQRKQTIAANKGQVPKRAELALIKAGAERSMRGKRIRDVRPEVYLNAERKASRLAFEAMARQDFEVAYEQKRKQLINHEMYRAALNARKAAESTQKYLSKFNGPTIQRKMGKAGVLEQINAILEGIDLKRKSLARVDRENALRGIREMVESGRFIVTPDTLRMVMDETVNWQELTLEQFLGMRDLIKQIEKTAEANAEMSVNGEMVNFEAAETEVVEQIYDANEKVDLRAGGVRTPGETVNKNVDQAIRTWLRPGSIARILDKAGFGAITRRMIVPIRRANSEKLIPMVHAAQSDVAEIYKKHYSRKELSTMSRRRFRIEALDALYSKQELLSMALHWGSETNRSALLGGKDEGRQVYPEQAIRQALSLLDARDWAFVQDVWDYIDSYWSDVKDANGNVIREGLSTVEKRRRGIAPEKIERLSFTIRTIDGQEITVRGGYFPLRYDHSFEGGGQKAEIEDEFKNIASGVYVSASTRAGATYNRVRNHGKVVRLGLNIVDTHLREVIRDIAIGDEVLFVKRLLDSKNVRRALKKTNNQPALEALNLWLTDAAVGELPAENIFESSVSWIRTGFVKSKLAWNLAVMLLQFTGVFQTMAVIGSVNYARGVSKFAQNPAKAWKHVMETSKFLHARYTVGAWDKDVQDTKAHLESLFGSVPTTSKVIMTKLAYTYFLPIAKAQQVVDITTWLGAYHKGLNELNLAEADAVIYADTQVEAAQTSGFFSDRSGLERGTSGLRKNRQSQYIRIWTTLIAYMLAKLNIAYEKTKITNFRSPAEVSKYLTDLILLFTLEGIASAILYGRMPDEDDEPEDWAMWVAGATFDSAISGVPFVREVAAAHFGGGNTPIGVFSNDIYRLIEQAAQGEADTAAVDALLDVTGTALHLPTGQVSKTFRAIWKEDDTDFHEYFLGPERD